MRRALALALLAVAAGCGGEEDRGYPDEAVETFVAECRRQANASESSCRCVIEQLQVSMPYEEFEHADEALRANRAPAASSVGKLETAAKACVGR